VLQVVLRPGGLLVVLQVLAELHLAPRWSCFRGKEQKLQAACVCECLSALPLNRRGRSGAGKCQYVHSGQRYSPVSYKPATTAQFDQLAAFLRTATKHAKFGQLHAVEQTTLV